MNIKSMLCGAAILSIGVAAVFYPRNESRATARDVDTDYSIDTSANLEPGLRIAVVSKNTSGEFWKDIKDGMEKTIEAVNSAYGYTKEDAITMTFEGPDDETQVENQVNILDAVIAENPDVLCISVADMNSCYAQLESATENGIPVIVFDSNVSDTELVHTFCATDNELVGAAAAGQLCDAMGGSGEILIISVQEKTESARRRVQGFLSKSGQYEDISIADTLYYDESEDLKTAVEEALAQNPQIGGVFCENAECAEACLDAKLPEGCNPVIVGVDATSKQQDAVADGREYCIISQAPGQIAYETIMAALEAGSTGETGVGSEMKEILLKPEIITQDKLDNENYAQYLY